MKYKYNRNQVLLKNIIARKSVQICKYYIQCWEKVFAPLHIYLVFAFLSHFHVSDHQTNFNIRQR